MTDGACYAYTTGMDAYGYDDSGVRFTDSGKARYVTYDWEQFVAMWAVMDGMALSVLR